MVNRRIYWIISRRGVELLSIDMNALRKDSFCQTYDIVYQARHHPFSDPGCIPPGHDMLRALTPVASVPFPPAMDASVETKDQLIGLRLK